MEKHVMLEQLHFILRAIFLKLVFLLDFLYLSCIYVFLLSYLLFLHF